MKLRDALIQQAPSLALQRAAADEIARLDSKIKQVETLLTNLQPHIPQACIPGRAAFIDNYVDPALELLREARHA